MPVIKVLRDLEGLFNYSTDENPTSQQEYQEAVKNWVKTIVSLVDSNLWQPETEYVVGDTVKTPSLSKDTVLYCLGAGTTGAVEPDYTDMGIGDIITDGTVTWLIQPTSEAPTGVVQAFAGSTTPQGWLLCDGSAVSRTDYAALFAVIGTSYGAGDGTDTFNLPNLTDKFIEGSATSGTEHSAGLPNITGSFTPRSNNNGGNVSIISEGTGAFGYVGFITNYSTTSGQTSDGNSYAYGVNIDASRSSAIYGNSNTVQPPSVTMRYIIKY